MNIVMFHNGSVLGQQIIDTWCDKYGQTSNDHLVGNASLEDLEKYRPKLAILASDLPSEFEDLVLEKCRACKVSVLSVLGRGVTVLVGPLERPETPGCITCLQLRWDNTLEHSLQLFFEGSFAEPLEMSPSDLAALGDIVTDEIRSLISETPSAPNSKGNVGLYQAKQIEWVPILPSHDCPRCNLLPEDDPDLAQVQFTSHFVHDIEALRVNTVDFKRLERLLVHPQVGYISALNEHWDEDRYAQADAYIYTPAGGDIAGYGSGLSITTAKQSAVLEVLERSCGVQAVNRRPVIFDTYSGLVDRAIHPSKFGLHDDALFRSGTHALEPFDEEKKYSWVWAYSTKDHQSVLIPEQCAYYGPTADEKRFLSETSNGCALGGTIEEAILHGIFEVLERDGFLNMWYGKIPVPELMLGGHCPPKGSEVLNYLDERGFEVRLFDLSHDLSIPAICAVAVNRKNDYPKAVSGAACHIHPHEAVYGALRELAVQVLNLQRMAQEKREAATPMFSDARKIKEILDHVAVAALPEAYPRWKFLLRKGRRQIQSVEAAFPDTARQYQMDTRDIRQILCAVLDDLHGRGFDVIVVNQTSPEAAYAGLHAVKVLIPGMTPITFGHGFQRVRGLSRLYELPFRLGYSPRVLTEAELNQDPHPFS